MTRSYVGNAGLVVFTLLVVTVLSLVMGLASAFLIPLMLVAGFAWLLFYWALRHQGFRNPITPLDEGPTGRWADGQPLGRIESHELREEAIREQRHREAEAMAAKQQRYEKEREEVEKNWDPHDYEGPPPINPFP